MSPDIPPEPWHSFLTEVNALVPEEIYFHCLGGFVIQQLYGLPRATQDIDTLSVTPRAYIAPLMERAGNGSELHRSTGCIWT